MDRQCEGLSPWGKQETDSCAFFVEYFHPTELFIIAESEESIGKKNYQTEMKTNFLLSLLVLVLFGTRVMAQSSLLATLNHEGTISTFYGATALQKAHASAENGDVITLSSGTFLSVDITKAVTLRGAGMVLDAATQTEPTVLANNFKITIADDVTERLTIEGVYSNQKVNIVKLKNAMFLKNRMREIDISGNGYGTDLTFIHCRIAYLYSGNAYSNNSATFQNCIVSGISGENYIFHNSIIRGYNGGSMTLCYNSEYKNCIIAGGLANDASTTSTYYNNLFIGAEARRLSGIPNSTNVIVNKEDDKIKNFLNYSDDNDYKLTDEAKAIMKGTDGTEVGIYGGSLPYDPTPTNPQISKFNVAAKTTADGKLSVDIEVKSAE